MADALSHGGHRRKPGTGATPALARLIAVVIMAFAPTACMLHCRAADAVGLRAHGDTHALHFLPPPGQTPLREDASHAPLSDVRQLVNAVTQWLPIAPMRAVAARVSAPFVPRPGPVLLARAIEPEIPPPRQPASFLEVGRDG